MKAKKKQQQNIKKKKSLFLVRESLNTLPKGAMKREYSAFSNHALHQSQMVWH